MKRGSPDDIEEENKDGEITETKKSKKTKTATIPTWTDKESQLLKDLADDMQDGSVLNENYFHLLRQLKKVYLLRLAKEALIHTRQTGKSLNKLAKELKIPHCELYRSVGHYNRVVASAKESDLETITVVPIKKTDTIRLLKM